MIVVLLQEFEPCWTSSPICRLFWLLMWLPLNKNILSELSSEVVSLTSSGKLLLILRYILFGLGRFSTFIETDNLTFALAWFDTGSGMNIDKSNSEP